jgi:hypothetical protein
MVWQLLKIPLHYLQIDALRKHVVSAVLAEKRCGRAPDGQSGALTRARFANELLREASAHRVRVSVRQSVNRVCSRVTHLTHDVLDSAQVVELGCGDVAPMLIGLLAPSAFWLLPSRSLRSRSCRSSSAPAYENQCRENAVDGLVNIAEWA